MFRIRPLALVIALALVLAACGSKGTPAPGEDTTGAEETQTTEEETTTTLGVEIELTCLDDVAGYKIQACANYAPGFESGGTQDVDVTVTGGSLFTDEDFDYHDFCLAFSNLVSVFPDNAGFEPPNNLAPITGPQLEELGVEDTDATISYLSDVPLGLYAITDGTGVFDVIEEVEAQGVMASPHYLLTPAPSWTYGPHGAAEKIPGAWADLQPTGVSETGSRVVIIDTGTTGDTDTIGIDHAEPEGSVDPLVAGHGLFAASVVRRFNTDLKIDVYSVSSSGPLSEITVIDALLRADPEGKDVVNMSLGTYPCRTADPTLGLIQILSTLPSEVQVVASSGNDGKDHPPMYPASLGFANTIPQDDVGIFETSGIDLETLASRVTAVGALDVSGDPASWSNPAEVYAPGEHVVGWYHDGDPGNPSGLAVWSGTSFAAPHFAACLASAACSPP